MDPLTQGALGAAAAHVAFGRRLPRRAWLIGALAGMLADADVLIRSTADPLLAIEYHRHFTHALAFIPIGGALAALPWLALPAMRRAWPAVLGAALVGYATHGLLDACTTYGTRLLWPFSSLRVAWSNVSVIDPVVTLALIAGLVIALRRGTRRPAAAALCLVIAYLGVGALQRERALAAVERVAHAHGHVPVRMDAFPTLGNQLVWRCLYDSGGTLHALRVRVPWFGPARWQPGDSAVRVDLDDLPAPARADARVVRDFERFSHFSAGWTARPAADPGVIGDMRYSLRTETFEPVWGVRFNPGAPQPTQWVNRNRDRRIGARDAWAELRGAAARYRGLPAMPPAASAHAAPSVH
ncbi:MAG: metal-dependent hydrolase [Gammaproteobacteria bacterium]